MGPRSAKSAQQDGKLQKSSALCPPPRFSRNSRPSALAPQLIHSPGAGPSLHVHTGVRTRGPAPPRTRPGPRSPPPVRGEYPGRPLSPRPAAAFPAPRQLYPRAAPARRPAGPDSFAAPSRCLPGRPRPGHGRQPALPGAASAPRRLRLALRPAPGRCSEGSPRLARPPGCGLCPSPPSARCRRPRGVSPLLEVHGPVTSFFVVGDVY